MYVDRSSQAVLRTHMTLAAQHEDLLTSIREGFDRAVEIRIMDDLAGEVGIQPRIHLILKRGRKVGEMREIEDYDLFGFPDQESLQIRYQVTEGRVRRNGVVESEMIRAVIRKGL